MAHADFPSMKTMVCAQNFQAAFQIPSLKCELMAKNHKTFGEKQHGGARD